METCQAKHTPHTEETDDGRDNAARRIFDCFQEWLVILGYCNENYYIVNWLPSLKISLILKRFKSWCNSKLIMATAHNLHNVFLISS